MEIMFCKMNRGFYYTSLRDDYDQQIVYAYSELYCSRYKKWK